MSEKTGTMCFKGEALAHYGFGDPITRLAWIRHGVFHDELAQQAGLGDSDHVTSTSGARLPCRKICRYFTRDEYIEQSVAQLSDAWPRVFGSMAIRRLFRGIYDAACDVVGSVLIRRGQDAVHGRRETRRAFVPIAGLHHAMPATVRPAFACSTIAASPSNTSEKQHRVGASRLRRHRRPSRRRRSTTVSSMIRLSLFADIHEDGRYLYPGTGAASEVGTGSGRAKGTKLNVPLAPGAGDADFMRGLGCASRRISGCGEVRTSFCCSAGADSLSRAIRSLISAYSEERARARPRRCVFAVVGRPSIATGRIIVATGGGGYNRRNLARAWTRVVQALCLLAH